MSYNIKQILQDFEDDDFGFSAVSEEDYNRIINEKADTVEEYRERMVQIEKLVLPFFSKLLKTADKEYIYWPNRKEVIEKQIEKILKLTRE
jgi:hypothetical protein